MLTETAEFLKVLKMLMVDEMSILIPESASGAVERPYARSPANSAKWTHDPARSVRVAE